MRTIFALATARGKSGVAVIRISGPEAFSVASKLVGQVPEPGRFVYRPIFNDAGALIDRGLVLAFAGPRSFTGEDTVEFQIHGSMAVIRAVEVAIEATGLARYAEAGEFTRRALLNDRMDLGQVEALGDLIEAETEQQRVAAQALVDGRLGDLADTLRHDLLHALALIEVTIDFVDEEVPVDVTDDVLRVLDRILHRLQLEIDGSFIAERLRDGFEVAILGAPNVGKSTLLNRIAGREIAITSDTPGTTRDILEARVDLGGIPVTFLDTAGLREATDAVERMGIDRALLRAKGADLRIHLSEGGAVSKSANVHADDLVVVSKADGPGSEDGVSGLTGHGIDRLLDRVQERLEAKLAMAHTANRERHRVAMMAAASEIRTARDLISTSEFAEEIVAVHLRNAVSSLDSLVGAVDVEAVLGAIFSQFCIGK